MERSELAAIFRRLADEIEMKDKANADPRLSDVAPKPPPIDLDTVLGIQQALNKLRSPRFEKIVEDGVHGPLMTWILKEFQAGAGLPVTGKVDEATRNLIHQSIFGASQPHSHP